MSEWYDNMAPIAEYAAKRQDLHNSCLKSLIALILRVFKPGSPLTNRFDRSRLPSALILCALETEKPTDKPLSPLLIIQYSSLARS